MESHMPPSPRAGWNTSRTLTMTVVALAATMQIVVAVPFTVGLGLLAPLWGMAIGWILWVAAAVVLVVTARRRPLATPLVPVANAAALWLLVTIGEAGFGWTA